VLGPTEVGADLLHAAVLGLARQHAPGTAEFVLAGLVAVADEVVDAAGGRPSGPRVTAGSEVELTGLRDVLARLATLTRRSSTLAEALAGPSTGQRRAEAAYVGLGLPTPWPGGLRGAVDPRWGSTGLQDLQTVLQEGRRADAPAVVVLVGPALPRRTSATGGATTSPGWVGRSIVAAPDLAGTDRRRPIAGTPGPNRPCSWTGHHGTKRTDARSFRVRPTPSAGGRADDPRRQPAEGRPAGPTGTGRTPWQHYVDLIRAPTPADRRGGPHLPTSGTVRGARSRWYGWLPCSSTRAPSWLTWPGRLADSARLNCPPSRRIRRRPYEARRQGHPADGPGGSYPARPTSSPTRSRPARLRRWVCATGLIYTVWALLGLLSSFTILSQDQSVSFG